MMTPIESRRGRFAFALNPRNTVGSGHYPCSPRGTRDTQRHDGAHELSLPVVMMDSLRRTSVHVAVCLADTLGAVTLHHVVWY